MQNGLGQTLCEYARLRGSHGQHPAHEGGAARPSAGTVLHRYAAVWRSGSPFEPSDAEPSERSVDSIQQPPDAEARLRYFSYVQPTAPGPWDAVRRLAPTPFFSRLNYVKQLSTTSVGLNIEAAHNRLAHLLGAHDIAAAVVERACATAPAEALPTAPEVTATLLFALLHDAYHGPLGHSLDLIGDLVLRNLGGGSERIDKALLARQIDFAQNGVGDLWPMIRAVSRWTVAEDRTQWSLKLSPARAAERDPQVYAREVIAALGLLTKAERLAQERPEKYWLREVVDSALDADRLDYLLRDTHYLRFPCALTDSMVRTLISHVAVCAGKTFVPVFDMSRFRHEAVTVHQLRWDSRHETHIQEMTAVRQQLYVRVYEAPQKRALDEMIAHAVVWILRNEASVQAGQLDQFEWMLGRGTGGHVPPSERILPELLQGLAEITDDELFHLLYEVGTQPKHSVALALVHDVAVGRAFREVWRFDIPFASLEAAVARMNDLSCQFKALLTELGESVASGGRGGDAMRALFENYGGQVLEGLRALIDPASPAERTALLFFLERDYGRCFERREILERILWAEVLSGGGDTDLAARIGTALMAMARSLQWPCADNKETWTTERLKEYFRLTPLVFLSIPWVPKAVEDVKRMHWATEETVPLHARGVPIAAEHDWPKRLGQRFYPTCIFAPDALRCVKGFPELIARLAWKLLLSLAWYEADLVWHRGQSGWASLALPAGLETEGLIR